MSMRSFWCLVVVGLSVLLGIACSDATNAPTSRSQEALAQTATVTIRLPATLAPSSVVLAADGALRLADRVTIPASGAPTAIANAGTTETNVGADARVRDVWSRAPVVLRDRARVDGAARSEGTITQNAGVVVTGAIVEHAVLSPPSLTSWTVTLPSSDSGNVTLAPGASRNLAPGSYRNLTVNAGATLTLNAGTYFFQAIAIEPQGVVRLNSANGPIVVYARAGLTFRGSVSDPQGRAELLLVALGTAPVVLDSAFIGTIVAPQAPLTLASATHTGAFFGKNVDVRPDARLVSKPFPSIVPGACTGVPDNTSCSDNNGCTTNDRCKKGKCEGTPVVCPATGNACVGAFCDAATGTCLKTPLEGKPCNDGNPSTTGEMCLSGTCELPTTPDAFCGAETARAVSFVNEPNTWQAVRAVAQDAASYQALASMNDEEALAFTDFVVIPVVFHVLEHPDIAEVMDSQIFDLMDDLNRFFRTAATTGVQAAHARFSSAPRIQFELAKRGPTCGEATDGIHRVPTTTREFRADFFGIGGPISPWAVAPAGVPAWDPRKYLNIWIVSYRPGNVPATGFFNEIARARLPERHGMADDGIALTMSPDANFTVFTFPSESVLAHEVGHYFNLTHVDATNDSKVGTPQPQLCLGATAATCATEGDFVCDTPAMFRNLPGCPVVDNCVDTPENQPDQTENIMGSSAASCLNLWTFGQVDRMETALATARSSLLASDGNLPPEPSADAWIRDGEGDLGQQPNDLEIVWASDDLWVRRQADGRTVQQHQNPVFRPSDPNRVYVRVRNRGCQQAESTNVTLYWAKASTSLAWPTPWNGTESLPNGAPLGAAVGTQPTGVIPPGGSVVLEFAWSPQDPALYSSVGGDKSHFCLLANIGATPGAQDLYQLVKSSNDTAWKNVTVTTETSAFEETAAVGVDGRRGDRQRLEFSEVSSPASPGTLFEWGRVVVDLGPGLFARWVEGGRQAQDIDTAGIVGTRIPLLGSGSQLRNLPLQPGDHFTMNVIVEPLVTGEFEPRAGLDVYELEVTQFSEATNPVTPVGGQRFVLKTSRPPSSIPE